MAPHKSFLLPCWARDISLLKHDAHNIVLERVRTLNKLEKRDSIWYDSSLIVKDRAGIILSGITWNNKPCWVADHIDEFIVNLNKILWPDTVYNHRHIIFLAETRSNHKHEETNSGDCVFCRYLAYQECATELFASMLEGCEKWHATAQTLCNNQNRMALFMHTLSPSPLTKKKLPNWVQRPVLLEAQFRPIRAEILHARLLRKLTRRVAKAIENRQLMNALSYIFESNLAVALRSELRKELKERRSAQHSSWHQVNGFWAITKCAIEEVLKEYEEREEFPVPEGTRDHLRDWLSVRFETGGRSSAMVLPQEDAKGKEREGRG
ncbi:hypothetical protein F5Y19DRAFT_473400 [Xylariaceae sp. FL1651]|nr:hypothetical protein F5Y19DRAFT_473400 [Xylariaceae sp. FL1651]